MAGTVGAILRVEYLVEQVAIPVNAVVQIGVAARHSVTVGVYHLVARKPNDTRRHASSLSAGIEVGEVAGQSPTIVATVALAIVELTCSGVPIAIALSAFLTGELLKPPTIRVEVSTMLSIAVPESCGGQSVARVVENHGAVDNLVASVHINVGNGEVVEAVAKPRRAAFVAVPTPDDRQLMRGRVHVQRASLDSGVATAPEEDAGLAAIDIGSANIMFLHAVSQVAPYVSVARRLVLFELR